MPPSSRMRCCRPSAPREVGVACHLNDDGCCQAWPIPQNCDTSGQSHFLHHGGLAIILKIIQIVYRLFHDCKEKRCFRLECTICRPMHVSIWSASRTAGAVDMRRTRRDSVSHVGPDDCRWSSDCWEFTHGVMQSFVSQDICRDRPGGVVFCRPVNMWMPGAVKGSGRLELDGMT